MTPDPGRYEFASDNTAAICPEAWAALEEANTDAVASYGDDRRTARACDQIREIFETDCDVYFVFNGTAANALTLAQLCESFHSIICHEYSHIQTDECGAPEFFTKGSQRRLGLMFSVLAAQKMARLLASLSSFLRSSFRASSIIE